MAAPLPPVTPTAEESEEDLQEVLAWTRYQWDCPGCQSVCEIGHDPAGEVVECDVCGVKARVAETR